jgi:putative phosphoesterase
MNMDKEHKIAVISDTHGLIRSSAGKYLKDVDMIMHAGDVDEPGILEDLKKISPVVAARGNMDTGAWAERLPKFEIVQIDNISLYVRHNIDELDLDPEAAGIKVVISGHTHQPSVIKKSGVLFLNPGSIGPRRHDYPISMAIICIKNGLVNVELIELDE